MLTHSFTPLSPPFEHNFCFLVCFPQLWTLKEGLTLQVDICFRLSLINIGQRTILNVQVALSKYEKNGEEIIVIWVHDKLNIYAMLLRLKLKNRQEIQGHIFDVAVQFFIHYLVIIMLYFCREPVFNTSFCHCFRTLISYHNMNIPLELWYWQTIIKSEKRT